MKVDLHKKMLTLDGKTYIENKEELSLGTVAATYVATVPGDASIPANERKKRFLLAIKLYKASGPVDIDDADAELIKKIVNASTLPPFMTEQIVYAVEGKPNPLETAEVDEVDKAA